MNARAVRALPPYLFVIFGLLLRHLGSLLPRPRPQVLRLGVLSGVAEAGDGHESALGVAEAAEGVEAAEDVGQLLLPLALRPAALAALGELGGDLEAGGVLWREEQRGSFTIASISPTGCTHQAFGPGFYFCAWLILFTSSCCLGDLGSDSIQSKKQAQKLSPKLSQKTLQMYS